jgi:hypothetical protein
MLLKGILIGLFIGTCFGFILCSLLVAAKKGDRD